MTISPLKQSATRIPHRTYRISHSVISNGADAYTKICAGASLVQLYTGLIYEGPGLIARIKNDLIKLMNEDGFSSLHDAIGSEYYKN